MKLSLLDTNILITLFSKKYSDEMRAWLRKRRGKRHILATCGIVLSEFYRGIDRHHAEKYSFYLGNFSYLHSTRSIYENAGLLAYNLAKKGKTVPLIDCVIAQIAKQFHATLITFDKDFRKIPGIKIMTPKLRHSR